MLCSRYMCISLSLHTVYCIDCVFHRQDEAYRMRIMSQICKVGAAIEEALGTAQDVEGVVDPDDNVTVVQTRPQM